MNKTEQKWVEDPDLDQEEDGMIVRREIVEKDIVIDDDQSPVVAEIVQSQIERRGEIGEGEIVLTLVEGEGRIVPIRIGRVITMEETGWRDVVMNRRQSKSARRGSWHFPTALDQARRI